MAGKTFKQRVDEARADVRFLAPLEAKEILDGGSVALIDIGEAWQLEDRGTIPGARNITRGELDLRADPDPARSDPTLQDRNQKIILTCGGGGKAILMAKVLAEMGFTDVWVIRGGCAGWQKAGLSLVPPGPRTVEARPR
jgi:rhodanese-related sulfurtransferase